MNDMTRINLETTLVAPFAPRILVTNLGDYVVKRINDLADSQQNAKNVGDSLAGQIKDETEITDEEMDSIGIRSIFLDLGRHYVHSIFEQNNPNIGPKKYSAENFSITVDCTGAWFVNQKENEYNPVHNHTRCSISAVLYLKLPEFKPREYHGKSNIDGQIEFINSTVDHTLLSRGNFLVMPKIGQLFMFPSTLLHTVYPFQGAGIRRSLAFNLNYDLIENSNKG